MKRKKPIQNKFIMYLKTKAIVLLEWMRTNLFRKTVPPENVLCIHGTARSGTTWLMELLADSFDSFSIFEPLNKNWFSDAIQAFERQNPEIPHDPKEEQRFRYYFNNLYQGKIYSN